MYPTTTTATPTSIELTPNLLGRIHEAADDEPLIRVRPYPETDGIAAGPRFLRDFHTAPAGSLHRGNAPVYAAEIWFTDGKLQFYLRAPDPQDAIALVNAHYPNSDTQQITDAGFPDISPGQYVAGCHLELRHNAAYPVKHLDSRPPLDDDPYRTILSRLIGGDDETAILQVVFMPVTQTWTNRGLLGRFGGGNVAHIAEARRQGTVEGYLHPQVFQSKHDTQAADDVVAQLGRPAFATTIRVVTAASNASTAEHRLSRVADAVTALDHEHTNQGFLPRYSSASHLPAVLEATGMRALTPTSRLKRTFWGRRNVLTLRELTGLVHLPNEEVENPTVDWSRTAAGVGVPADVPAFSVPTSAADGVRLDDQTRAHYDDPRRELTDESEFDPFVSNPDLTGSGVRQRGEDDV
ncbi:hypothetical protein [Haladaptatus sp. DYSN1]|uniref:hypothetical protein n=1 Tax=unclassified Haladaptatus TaxID=2622732 RepID=UPI002404B330|nr:hypothetical protein [Haladaptatus sp. DYSN1]